MDCFNIVVIFSSDVYSPPRERFAKLNVMCNIYVYSILLLRIYKLFPLWMRTLFKCFSLSGKPVGALFVLTNSKF